MATSGSSDPDLKQIWKWACDHMSQWSSEKWNIQTFIPVDQNLVIASELQNKTLSQDCVTNIEIYVKIFVNNKKCWDIPMVLFWLIYWFFPPQIINNPCTCT